ncbi:MAG: conditioned medium-induced protein 4 [Halobacteriales archaeon]|nr:conditioned medium-induced protein 4 [Halobacteriales archaeon]
MTDDEEREKKAEELRDIFVEVTDESTVTEEREEERGTLPGEEEIDDEIRGTVDEMRDEYGFETSLEDDDVVQVVRLYNDGASDAEIARELGDDSLDKTVRRARIGLHLFHDSDFDAPFDIDRLEELLDEEATNSEIADELDVSSSTVRSYRRAVEARRESEEADGEYAERFEAVLEDHEISERFTPNAKRDGLEDATEDAEVDVDL